MIPRISEFGGPRSRFERKSCSSILHSEFRSKLACCPHQANARSPPVLDELDPRGLERRLQHAQCRAVRLALAVLELVDRVAVDIRALGKVLEGPTQEPSGSAALLFRHAHNDISRYRAGTCA